MNRPLKFRVWDLTVCKYIEGWPFYVGEINFGDEVIIEQFTGLHDSDGKEIWEGDLLESAVPSKRPAEEVFFEDGTFKVGTWPLHILFKLLTANGHTWKVVGNIFEGEK